MRRCTREWPFPRRRRSLETLPTNIPKMPYTPELVTERRSRKFLGQEKILHPSQPVVAAGEISPLCKALRPRGGPAQLPWARPAKPPVPLLKTPTPSKTSLPVQGLAVIWPMTPQHGFAGVTACLQMPEPLEMASEVPCGTVSIGVMVTPGISTMSTSCIIRDEATGVTYMDTVTTSIGRVALSSPDSEASSQGPTIEDVTDHE